MMRQDTTMVDQLPFLINYHIVLKIIKNKETSFGCNDLQVYDLSKLPTNISFG